MISVLATGCGAAKSKVINGDVSNNVYEEGQTVETETEEKQVTTTSTEEKVAESICYQAGDVSIIMGAEAKPIMDKLGEPLSRFESPSCAFGDLDVIYTYPGFEIDTYTENNTEYISAVILLDDSVTTKEGLMIGDDVSKAEELYPNPTTEENGNKIYIEDKTKFIIFISYGKVSSIQYLYDILN